MTTDVLLLAAHSTVVHLAEKVIGNPGRITIFQSYFHYKNLNWLSIIKDTSSTKTAKIVVSNVTPEDSEDPVF